MAETIIRTGLVADIKPSLLNFYKFGFAVDGINKPYYFNVYESFSWWHKDPTATPTVATTGSGTYSATIGIRYAFTEVNLDSGDVHTSHETNLSPVSASTGVFTNKASVTVTLPTTSVNESGNMTYLKVYGTSDGGSQYYYLGRVSLGTSTFSDTNITRDPNLIFGKITVDPDTGTETVTYLNYPIRNHAYCTATKERIFVCGAKLYSTGTVAVTQYSATVTGTGTAWAASMAGSQFQIINDSRIYYILSVESATSLTLTANFASASGSGFSYGIKEDGQYVRFTTMHPITAYPMWWAFPADNWVKIMRKDWTEIQGISTMADQPVVFKEYSHYLLTKVGADEFEVSECATQVGTKSNLTIKQASPLGTLLFLSSECKLFETDATQAKDLNVDLNKIPGGVNVTRREYFEATWLESLQWYMLLYASEGSSTQDKVLVYDYQTTEYWILDYRMNCMNRIVSTSGSQTYIKPWFGSVGGFIYMGMSSYANYGSGTTGTLMGTSTAIGAATLTDSTATFNTTGNGLKDIYIRLYNTAGVYQEEKKILSNTGTIITVNTNWTSSPVAGWTYKIGAIPLTWKSAIFDFGATNRKWVDKLNLAFEKVGSVRNVKINLFFSMDTEMPTTASQIITVDLSKDYYKPISIGFNDFRYFQYEIVFDGVNEPITINNIVFTINQFMV